MDYFDITTLPEITVDNDIITVDNDLIIIGTNQQDDHTFKFIPRKYTEPTLLVIHDELKNKQYNVVPKNFVIGRFITIVFDFDFRILASYQLEVFTNEELIYRSKAKAI